MTTFLITYDLNKETTRPPIVKKIKELGTGYARLSESSYAITYGGSVEQVYQALKPMLDSNDHFYVVTLKKPWTGYGPKDVNQWLENNLTY